MWKLFWLSLPIACVTGANAQPYPSTTLRFIVSGAPGVLSDTLPRGLVEPLRISLGRPVVVENRVGADGLIAADACARAAPDGHAICVSGGTMMTLNPVMRAKLPYDALRDFAGIVHSGFFDSLLLVPASLPVTSVAQLADLARAKPEALVWGHFGHTTSGYLYAEWMKKGRGAPFYAVPYKTQPQAMQALLAGESQAGVFSWTSALSHLKAGKLKALAVTADKRLGFLPGVATFEEEGIKLPLRPWFGYHVPIATPRPIVQRLNAELRKAMAEPAYRDIMSKLGVVPNEGTPEDLDIFVREQIRLTAEMFNFIGMKPLSD